MAVVNLKGALTLKTLQLHCESKSEKQHVQFQLKNFLQTFINIQLLSVHFFFQSRWLTPGKGRCSLTDGVQNRRSLGYF